MTEFASIPIGLGMLGIGSVLVASGVTGNSLGEILQGNFVGKGATASASASASTSASASASPSVGTPQIDLLFRTMDSMVGRPYNWGGGHLGYSASDNWDCSGAVSYALHTAGMLKGPPRVSGAFMLWGDPGIGKYFTVFSNPIHVYIRSEFANRKGQVWSANHSGSGGECNWRDGHTFNPSQYTARHYPGF